MGGFQMWRDKRRRTVDAISVEITGRPEDQHSPKGALSSSMGVSPSWQQNGPWPEGPVQSVQLVSAQTCSVSSLAPQSLAAAVRFEVRRGQEENLEFQSGKADRTVRATVCTSTIPTICTDRTASIAIIEAVDDVLSNALIGIAGTGASAMCESKT
jgi:hypothetical protein